MFNSPRQLSIDLWNVVGAFVALNGIVSHSQKPSEPQAKVV